MNILIGCEFSGRVRSAFRELGYDAWSCDLDDDLFNSEYHLKMDIFEAIKLKKWDLMIAFPPCTYLTVAGNRWYKDSPLRKEAVEFVRELYNVDIPHIAIENPVGVLSTQWKSPSQIIHPWQYGHPEKKRTCLWQKRVPKLVPTNIVSHNGNSEVLKYGHYANTQKVRSLTYYGIAEAMANQWQPEKILPLRSLPAANF